MDKYCDKCFVDNEKEPHQDFCPHKKIKADLPPGFEDLFTGLTKNRDK